MKRRLDFFILMLCIFFGITDPLPASTLKVDVFGSYEGFIGIKTLSATNSLYLDASWSCAQYRLLVSPVPHFKLGFEMQDHQAEWSLFQTNTVSSISNSMTNYLPSTNRLQGAFSSSLSRIAFMIDLGDGLSVETGWNTRFPSLLPDRVGISVSNRGIPLRASYRLSRSPVFGWNQFSADIIGADGDFSLSFFDHCLNMGGDISETLGLDCQLQAFVLDSRRDGLSNSYYLFQMMALSGRAALCWKPVEGLIIRFGSGYTRISGGQDMENLSLDSFLVGNYHLGSLQSTGSLFDANLDITFTNRFAVKAGFSAYSNSDSILLRPRQGFGLYTINGMAILYGNSPRLSAAYFWKWPEALLYSLELGGSWIPADGLSAFWQRGLLFSPPDASEQINSTLERLDIYYADFSVRYRYREYEAGLSFRQYVPVPVLKSVSVSNSSPAGGGSGGGTSGTSAGDVYYGGGVIRLWFNVRY